MSSTSVRTGEVAPWVDPVPVDPEELETTVEGIDARLQCLDEQINRAQLEISNLILEKTILKAEFNSQ